MTQKAGTQHDFLYTLEALSYFLGLLGKLTEFSLTKMQAPAWRLKLERMREPLNHTHGNN